MEFLLELTVLVPYGGETNYQSRSQYNSVISNDFWITGDAWLCSLHNVQILEGNHYF